MPERLMVFFDAEYVIQSLRRLKNYRGRVPLNNILWENILQFIVQQRNLSGCYYYSSLLDKQENLQTCQIQQNYLKTLPKKLPGVQLRIGHMIRVRARRVEGEAPVYAWTQKGIDIRIAVDMLSQAYLNGYDTAALVAGDADFTDLIRKIRQHCQKKIELYTFDRTDVGVDENLRKIANLHSQITKAMGDQANFWWQK